MFSALKRIISPSKRQESEGTDSGAEESVNGTPTGQGSGSGPSRTRTDHRSARLTSGTPYNSSSRGTGGRRQSFFSGLVQKLNPFSPSPASTPSRVLPSENNEMDVESDKEQVLNEPPAKKPMANGTKKIKLTLVDESVNFLGTNDSFAAADAEFQGLVQTLQPPIQPFTDPLPKEPVSLSSSSTHTVNNPLEKVCQRPYSAP